MFDEDPTTDPVKDDLDVDAELAALGMSEADLDAALDDQEQLAGLDDLLEPDPGMVERVTGRVERRIADRETLAAIADLIGLGWFTIRALFDGEDER